MPNPKIRVIRVILTHATGGGSGDVVGPNGATDGHLAVFDGGTGKLIKDGGAVPSGGNLSVIDLGPVSTRDATLNGRNNILIPYADGRLIKSIRFVPHTVPTVYVSYFATPNTGANISNGTEGFARVDNDLAHDTLSLVPLAIQGSTGNTGISGNRFSSGNGDYTQILDCGPVIFFASGPFDNNANPLPVGTWQANTPYCQYDRILDSNGHIQTVSFPGGGGVSGNTEPVWSDSGGTVSDGSIQTWQDGGLPDDAYIHAIVEVIEGVSPMPLYPASIEFLVPPQNTVAGEVMPDVTVIVKDQHGDPYTFMSASVDLACYGDLQGNYFAFGNLSQSTDPDTGIATFSGITPTNPGTFILRSMLSTCLVADPIYSDPFDVTAP